MTPALTCVRPDCSRGLRSDWMEMSARLGRGAETSSWDALRSTEVKLLAASAGSLSQPRDFPLMLITLSSFLELLMTRLVWVYILKISYEKCLWPVILHSGVMITSVQLLSRDDEKTSLLLPDITKWQLWGTRPCRWLGGRFSRYHQHLNHLIRPQCCYFAELLCWFTWQNFWVLWFGLVSSQSGCLWGMTLLPPHF